MKIKKILCRIKSSGFNNIFINIGYTEFNLKKSQIVLCFDYETDKTRNTTVSRNFVSFPLNYSKIKIKVLINNNEIFLPRDNLCYLIGIQNDDYKMYLNHIQNERFEFEKLFYNLLIENIENSNLLLRYIDFDEVLEKTLNDIIFHKDNKILCFNESSYSQIEKIIDNLNKSYNKYFTSKQDEKISKSMFYLITSMQRYFQKELNGF